AGLARVGLKIRAFAWDFAASYFTTRRPTAWWLSAFDWGLRPFLGGLAHSFSAYRVDALINFKRERRHYFDFTFWAFPTTTWQPTVRAYLDFCHDYRRRTGYRPSLPTEVYYVRRDTGSLLSFSAHSDIFTLDMVDTRPRSPSDTCHWRDINREFNDFAAHHGGRPLLNQTKELSAAVVHETLADDWRSFVTIVGKEDPSGRFLNRFFLDLFHTAGESGERKD